MEDIPKSPPAVDRNSVPPPPIPGQVKDVTFKDRLSAMSAILRQNATSNSGAPATVATDGWTAVASQRGTPKASYTAKELAHGDMILLVKAHDDSKALEREHLTVGA
eukprot:scaffold304829_cov71-Attheya_sp.AAC.2